MLRRGLLALAALAGFVGAPPVARAVEVQVSLATGETQFGVINSSLRSFGSLEWQLNGSNESSYLLNIDSADAKRSRQVAVGSIESSAVRNLNIKLSFSIFEVVDQAAILAEAKRSAKIYIKNGVTEEYRDPFGLLNAPDLADQRNFYASFCPAASCRFIFIYQATSVDEGGLGFGRATGAGVSLKFPTKIRLGGVDASISYENNAQLSWAGKATPMFYKALRTRLVKTTTGYMFIPDVRR